jgi:hypothetical protein
MSCTPPTPAVLEFLETFTPAMPPQLPESRFSERAKVRLSGRMAPIHMPASYGHDRATTDRTSQGILPTNQGGPAHSSNERLLYS